MQMSEQINELAGALAKAQGEMKAAAKDAKNPHLGNRYADLNSVWDSCREPLSRNGLSLVQLTVDAPDGFIGVHTMLLHASGQFLGSTLFLPWASAKGLSDAQAFGSGLTYARRYGMSATLGIVSDDDTDGNAVSHGSIPSSRPTTSTPGPSGTGPGSPAQTAARAPLTVDQAEKLLKEKMLKAHFEHGEIIKASEFFRSSLTDAEKLEIARATATDVMSGKIKPGYFIPAPGSEKAA